MTTPQHRPPSRERYAANHPALTVHFDLDLYKKIVELRERSGLTLNQLVRQALGSVEDHVAAIQSVARKRGFDMGMETGYDIGYYTGYDAAKEEYGLVIACDVCDEDIDILAEAPIAERALELLRDEDWGHAACHEQRRVAAGPPPAPRSGPHTWSGPKP